jgi:hypothetical protein
MSTPDKTEFFFKAENADRFENSQRTQRVGIGGIFRLFERDGHMALRSQIVNLVRLNFLHDPDQARRVRQVAMMKSRSYLVMRIVIKMIDAIGIEQRGAPFDP